MRFSVDPDDLLAAAILALAGVAALGISRWHRRAAQRLWALALVAVTVPFGDLHAHAHWANVGWIPYVTPPIKLSDVLSNMAIYVPLGFLAPQCEKRGGYGRVVAAAAVLSFCCELTQLFSHSRFPSFTDVLNNTAGAVLGRWLAIHTNGSARSAVTERERTRTDRSRINDL